MNRFTVISTKMLNKKTGEISKLIEYQNILTKAASKCNGYISSTSYWKQSITSQPTDIYSNICNLSYWESEEDWDRWLASDIRYNIHNTYNTHLKKENHEILRIRNNYIDTPLL